ncbi:uncharacterized protein AC631_00155 [Debaryomyces fabryi]|uniref:4-hydroxy-tetrahydrodipicolinate synthase n=1 Tax=Debaryomyces fabryi TaxID=58627 RepID=A0A0V1Q6L2_9ASCO|nr:uncharacterized protein AC631_00155 [Debaryomyces fabryi]KSA04076.1 hypothetical protein AC631_00155 [Debaryomyces fabryi]CUM50200.1 unnamed protein product [Debaryomyces fabryi]
MGKFLPFTIAAVTPFTEQGDFDPKSVPGLIQYLVKEANAPGLLICGSTGEQHIMSIEDRLELYSSVRNTVGTNYPLYAGVAAFTTKDAIRLAKGAEKDGYQAVMLGFPPYRIPTQKEAIEYVIDVCKAIPSTLVFLYNNPKRTGFNLSVESLVNIVNQVPNVEGLKQAGNRADVPLAILQLSRKIQFLSGFDATIVEDFQMGYSAITSIAGNIFPNQTAELIHWIENGEKGNKIEERQTLIRDAITFVGENGALPCLKYILRKRGVSAGFCPPPLKDPSTDLALSLDKYC